MDGMLRGEEGDAATHRLVGLVVAEVLLVPDDVLALMLGGVARPRASHVHVGHGMARVGVVGAPRHGTAYS